MGLSRVELKIVKWEKKKAIHQLGLAKCNKRLAEYRKQLQLAAASGSASSTSSSSTSTSVLAPLAKVMGPEAKQLALPAP